jgi:hypothetical protein
MAQAYGDDQQQVAVFRRLAQDRARALQRLGVASFLLQPAQPADLQLDRRRRREGDGGVHAVWRAQVTGGA